MGKEKINPFTTNPEKAGSKIRINNDLILACITIFTFIWAFAPNKLSFWLIIQFVFAVPLLYISNTAYTKIAYKKETKLWDYFGWFTGTTGIALVFNILGILIYLLGFMTIFYLYFALLWFLMLIYTIINIHYHPSSIKIRIFKFLYFVLIQVIFGLGFIFL
jgi:hypothetical protein